MPLLGLSEAENPAFYMVNNSHHALSNRSSTRFDWFFRFDWRNEENGGSSNYWR